MSSQPLKPTFKPSADSRLEESPSFPGLLISETVVPVFEFIDHVFSTAGGFIELLGQEKAVKSAREEVIFKYAASVEKAYESKVAQFAISLLNRILKAQTHHLPP